MSDFAKTNAELFEKFSTPFPTAELLFRTGATNSDKTKALALVYVDARSIMGKLDEVAGPSNWKNSYDFGPNGEILSTISVRLPDTGEWLDKSDGAEQTQIEAVKGGLSDSFKRAAVMWGIGRYLYTFPHIWVKTKIVGKNTIVLDEIPPIPESFYPPGETPNKTPKRTPQTSAAPEEPVVAALPEYDVERYNRALAYKVPPTAVSAVGQRAPQKEKTLAELEGTSSGRKVISYIAGETSDKAGKDFSASGDTVALQNAARYIIKYRSEHGKNTGS